MGICFPMREDNKRRPSAEFRIPSGEVRYGLMRGRLAAASGELPRKSAARAGGIAQLRTPPTRPFAHGKDVVMGFTFRRVRTGFASE